MSTIPSGISTIPTSDSLARDSSAWSPTMNQRPPDRSRDLALEQRLQEARRGGAAMFTGAAELAGLGENLEELTFGASEREELEVHGEDQDAYEQKVEEIDRLLPVEEVRELMRQLEGRPGAALLRQRAEQFASRWRSGHHEWALDSLGPEAMPAVERYAIMRTALEHMPEGDAAERLEAGLRSFDPDAVRQVHRLIRVFEAGHRERRETSPAAGAALRTLLMSPPNLKLVLEKASGIGVDGLDKLEASATRPTRNTDGASALAQVGMNLCLLRMVGQLRDAQRSCGRLFDEAGGKPAGPEETKKAVLWLLDLCGAASATATRSALNRMTTVIPTSDDRRFLVVLQLQREFKKLPSGMWSDGGKAHLELALRQDVGAKCDAARKAASEAARKASIHGMVRSPL